jgi:Protein of unknown function (DUF2795)
VTRRALAELQVALEGTPLPASKQALLERAQAERLNGELTGLLERLPEGEYRSLDEVAETLQPVQPPRAAGRATLPRPESGPPPGSDAYLDPSPDPGRVRERSPE